MAVNANDCKFAIDEDFERLSFLQSDITGIEAADVEDALSHFLILLPRAERVAVVAG